MILSTDGKSTSGKAPPLWDPTLKLSRNQLVYGHFSWLKYILFNNVYFGADVKLFLSHKLRSLLLHEETKILNGTS